MPTITAKVEGVEQLEAALKTLEGKLATQIVKKALRDGAKIIKTAVDGTVPVLTGKTKAAVKIRAGKGRSGYTSIVVTIGDQWFSGDTFYAAFVEFGHRLGSRRLGAKRKLIPGQHFMQYAFDESKDSALAAIIATLRTLIEQAAGEK